MNKHTPIGRSARIALKPELSAERKRAWQAENAGAIASYNEWVRENGLLLGPYRKV